MKILTLLGVVFVLLFSKVEVHTYDDSLYSQNIWLKTYKNIRNYESTINKIIKLEAKLEKAKRGKYAQDVISDIDSQLNLQKSKLTLFQKNNNFMNILVPYDINVNEITLYDYLFKTTKEKFDQLLKKFRNTNNDFFVAKAYLQNELKISLKNDKTLNKKSRRSAQLLKDLNYFNEFEEVLNKTEQNLLDTGNEITKKYVEYRTNSLNKHIGTLIIIAICIILYLIIVKLFGAYLETNQKNSYQKVLALLFTIIIMAFLFIRYSENLLYVFTLMGFIAAALAIAIKEIILNIAGWVYIFFTNAINVGDRILFVFETKHTLGDVKSFSLMKITLNEVENYNSLKEIKNSGRTIHVPNSYVFTKVFYNYTTKNKGYIRDLVELDFDINNDFDAIEKLTQEVLDLPQLKEQIPNYGTSFSLNSLKTAITLSIWFLSNYKVQDKTKSDLTIQLIQRFNDDETIKLKNKTAKAVKEEIS